MHHSPYLHLPVHFQKAPCYLVLLSLYFSGALCPYLDKDDDAKSTLTCLSTSALLKNLCCDNSEVISPLSGFWRFH